MDIIDDRSFKEYYNTVYQEEMKRIEGIASSYSGSEHRFHRDRLRLDYFANFLTKYQYFDKKEEKKTFLQTVKDIFLFLNDRERKYTPDMEKTDESRNFIERRNNFRLMTRSFVNVIVETAFLFRRDDNEVGVYHKYKTQGSQFYNLDALTVLDTFSKDYSLFLNDLITYELHQGMISNALRELLDRTKLLDRLQEVCAKEWYALSQEIQDMDVKSSPILQIYFEGRSKRKKRGRFQQPSNLKLFLMLLINQTKLIAQSPELTQMVKAEELLEITTVIKELLAELREGDEIAENDALAIIEENRPLEYLSQNELAEYFKQLLIDLPDFEYVRLKKSFRRSTSQKAEMFTNIDSLYLHSIPSSLKNIEESLLEIHQNQTVLLEQTQQLQTVLESQFDLVIENQAKIEEYLFEKLGSDFEKIKHLWVMYKEKQLTGREFVQKATKILGTKFSRIIMGMLFLLK